MELNLSNWKRQLDLSWGQWLAVSLIGLMLLAITFSLVAHFSRQPVVIDTDFAPFASQQEYQDFNKQHSVMRATVPASAHFNFRTSVSPTKQLVVQIYLLQLAVKADDTKSQANYVASLQKFQQEAKDWFKEQGEDLSKDYVQWYPNPDSFGPTPSPTPHAPIGTVIP